MQGRFGKTRCHRRRQTSATPLDELKIYFMENNEGSFPIIFIKSPSFQRPTLGSGATKMVQGMFKSGRFARKHVRVPGGRTVLRFEERLPRQAHCAECGRSLPGIPRMSRVAAKHTPKTAKRPERPYGGVLCGSCMRTKIIAQHRK